MVTSKDTVPALDAELLQLTNCLESQAEKLAHGDVFMQRAALEATKYVFDTSLHTEGTSYPHVSRLLSTLLDSQAPSTRATTQRKRKRSPSPNPRGEVGLTATPLERLIVEDMDEDQVWAQMSLKIENVCEMLGVLLEGDDDVDPGQDEAGKSLAAPSAFIRGQLQDVSEDIMFVDGEGSPMESDEESDGSEVDEGTGADDWDEETEYNESTMNLRDASDEDSLPEEDRSDPTQPQSRLRRQLHDDFFDLSSFNAETERAEARTSSAGHLADSDGSDDESLDLFAPVSIGDDSDRVTQADNDIYYRDFFDPPRRAHPIKGGLALEASNASKGKVRFDDAVRVKKINREGKSLPVNETESEGDILNLIQNYEAEEGAGQTLIASPSINDPQGVESEDSERGDDADEGYSKNEDQVMDMLGRIKQDLFAEEPNATQTDLSTHERRMAHLREQILTLESENVGQKEWVLMGEATSRSRPQNSLLEEDLEFERVLKPTPVITAQSVESLEAQIKARILESRFDDVVRIRRFEDKPFLPSRFFELKDSKSAQSLAEVYEEEYLTTQGSTTKASGNTKLEDEHRAITTFWESISSKLDALCNAHFTPKQPQATISTISNTSTTTLESALPTSASTTTLLAPEEILAPQSAPLRTKTELTPTEKKSLHHKQRKLRRRARDHLEKTIEKAAKARKPSVKKQKEAALASVIKTGKGVTVVGKNDTRHNRKKQT